MTKFIINNDEEKDIKFPVTLQRGVSSIDGGVILSIGGIDILQITEDGFLKLFEDINPMRTGVVICPDGRIAIATN